MLTCMVLYVLRYNYMFLCAHTYMLLGSGSDAIRSFGIGYVHHIALPLLSTPVTHSMLTVHTAWQWLVLSAPAATDSTHSKLPTYYRRTPLRLGQATFTQRQHKVVHYVEQILHSPATQVAGGSMETLAQCRHGCLLGQSDRPSILC
jgi:hypothetical protein